MTPTQLAALALLIMSTLVTLIIFIRTWRKARIR